MTEHHVHREWSAGYVLGALEPGERRQFEDHLADCEECRREVADFAPIPGLLSRLDSADFEPAPLGVTAAAVQNVRSEWAAVNRSRRRWQWIASTAAVIALATALASVLPTSRVAVEWTVESNVATSGTITLESRAWGTAIHLELDDLPWRDGYIAWVVNESGEAQQVAVWGPTESGRAILDSTSSLDLESVTLVAVTGLDGSERLLSAAG